MFVHGRTCIHENTDADGIVPKQLKSENFPWRLPLIQKAQFAEFQVVDREAVCIFHVEDETDLIDSNAEVVTPCAWSGSNACICLRIDATHLSRERKDQQAADNPGMAHCALSAAALR